MYLLEVVLAKEHGIMGIFEMSIRISTGLKPSMINSRMHHHAIARLCSETSSTSLRVGPWKETRFPSYGRRSSAHCLAAKLIGGPNREDEACPPSFPRAHPRETECGGT